MYDVVIDLRRKLFELLNVGESDQCYPFEKSIIWMKIQKNI